MEYPTRHLVAIGAMKHEGREIEAGESFHPTEVDAKYYLAHRLAIEPQTSAAAPAPKARAATPAAPSGARTGLSRPARGPTVSSAARALTGLLAEPARPATDAEQA